MKWREHGVVWAPDGSLPWARSHATCPTPVQLPDGILRVFIQCRDSENVGRVGFVDLDPEDPRKVVRAAREPVLDAGAPGHFDDNGVFQTCVFFGPDGRLWMYFVGFELCHRIRYRLLTGLAFSEDGGLSFRRAKTTPILERSPAEPFFRCGPFVLCEEGIFRMWYIGGGGWEEVGGKAMPVYDLRYMESSDGVHWPEAGRVVLPVSDPDEHGFGRPYVVRDRGGYRMHYSIRKRSLGQYRMGYATSPDGLAWTRRDGDLGLEVAPGTWKSEALAYGAEVPLGERTWLLYNGNDFGGTGFGLAERVEA